MLSVPESFWADLSEIVSEVFSDLLPLLVMVIAVLLGFFVIESIIRAIRR